MEEELAEARSEKHPQEVEADRVQAAAGSILHAMAKTLSEEWFERYLREHGIDGWQAHHPPLGTGRRPDYLVSKDGAQAVCEVKQSSSTRIRDAIARFGPRPGGMLSSSEVYGGVRSLVAQAAGQLKELAGTAPLVVVLANPLGADIDLRPEEVIHALYGDPTVPLLTDPATGRVVGGELSPHRAVTIRAPG